MTVMKNKESNWSFLIEFLKFGQCSPVISDRLILNWVLEADKVMGQWADHIQYPFEDRSNRAALAQFSASTSGDAILAKSAYLKFLKEALFEELLASDKFDYQNVEAYRAYEPKASFSEVVSEFRVGLEKESDNSLLQLAALPMPVIVTTSYHTIIEEALRLVGKEPLSLSCDWRQNDLFQLQFQPNVGLRLLLRDYFSVDELRLLCFDMGIDYETLEGEGKDRKIVELVTFVQRRLILGEFVAVGKTHRPELPWDEVLERSEESRPSLPGLGSAALRDLTSQGAGLRPEVDSPLVYHLFGVESDQASMIITEEAMLDVLISISRGGSAIAPRVAQALTYSSLLVLGYDWNSLAFKVLERLLHTFRQESPRLSLMNLPEPESNASNYPGWEEAARTFVEQRQYKHNMRIFWGEWQTLIQELFDGWIETG